MKLYVVTVGTYYDYHIVAIFDDEVKAKNFIEDMDCAQITPWELNNPGNVIRNGKFEYFVRMQKDGNVKYIEKLDNITLEKTESIFYVIEGLLTGHAMAIDKKHAIKIANEERLQMLANNEWK